MMQMPAVSNIIVVNGHKKLTIDFRAYRKLEGFEIQRLLGTFLSSKDGRKMVRSGGQVVVFTSMGGR